MNFSIIRPKILYLLFAICCSYFAGCANNVPDASDAELYAKANYDLDKDYFTTAIQKLKGIETRFPFSIFSVQAQLDLIYAYYCSGSYPLCQAAASRFIRMHPNHPNVDYCYYMKGLSSYANYTRGSKFPINLATRASGDAKVAFQELSEFIELFPNSRYTADAHQRVISIKNNLAKHELFVGRFYLKKHAYIAAVNRGQTVVSSFQNSSATADALALMIEGYKKLNLKKDADKTLNILKINFPNHYTLKNGRFSYYYKNTKSSNKKTVIGRTQKTTKIARVKINQ